MRTRKQTGGVTFTERMDQIVSYMMGEAEENEENGNGNRFDPKEWIMDYFMSISNTVAGNNIRKYILSKRIKEAYPDLAPQPLHNLRYMAKEYIKPLRRSKTVKKEKSA